MFFGNKKSKVDPKIRFQNRQFNQKLQQARTFKRTARPIPEGGFSRLLAQIGLGSLWKQSFIILMFGGALYLAYIPNFLSLQAISIEGMSESERAVTEAALRDSIGNAPFYNPQRNLLLLSKNRITEVLTNIASVDKINSITKDFQTKTLNISITSKYEKFLVRSGDTVYDVYNDGMLKGSAGVDRESWVTLDNPNMAKVEINGKIINSDQKEFFNNRSAKYMAKLQEELKGITGSPLAYLRIVLPEFREPEPVVESPTPQDQPELADEVQVVQEVDEIGEIEPLKKPEPTNDTEITLPINSDELEIVLQKGWGSNRTFRVIIDTHEDAREVVLRLNLLLSQTPGDRYNNFSYVDMRIKSRAYICLLNTVCN